MPDSLIIKLFADPKVISPNCVTVGGYHQFKAFTAEEKAIANENGYTDQQISIKVVGPEAEVCSMTLRKGTKVEVPPHFSVKAQKYFSTKKNRDEFVVEYTTKFCPAIVDDSSSEPPAKGASKQEPIMSQEEYAEKAKSFFGGNKK